MAVPAGVLGGISDTTRCVSPSEMLRFMFSVHQCQVQSLVRVMMVRSTEYNRLAGLWAPSKKCLGIYVVAHSTTKDRGLLQIEGIIVRSVSI
jgi:hypothetical protein